MNEVLKISGATPMTIKSFNMQNEVDGAGVYFMNPHFNWYVLNINTIKI